MGEHVLTVDVTSDNWVHVSFTIGMESRFPKVGSESRICQPSGWLLIVLSCWINHNLMLCRLASLLEGIFVYPHLPAVVICLLNCWLRNL